MKTVLIIDDDLEFRCCLKYLLYHQGYLTVEGHNGALGIRLAKDFLPDLILCDLNGPEVDGVGVISEIRQFLATSLIPLIFLTSTPTQVDRHHATVLGANACLGKSVNAEDLLFVIDVYMAQPDRNDLGQSIRSADCKSAVP